MYLFGLLIGVVVMLFVVVVGFVWIDWCIVLCFVVVVVLLFVLL